MTTRPVNTEKIQKAISVLEILSGAQSETILQALKEHRGATFLELMLYTGLSGEELKLHLEQLGETGVVTTGEAEWQPRFSLHEKRLSVLVTCAQALARGATFSAHTYSRDVP